MNYASIVPLIGGETIAMENVFECCEIKLHELDTTEILQNLSSNMSYVKCKLKSLENLKH